MRPYREWPRSEIHERRRAILAEQDQLARARKAVERDTALGESESLDLQLDMRKRSNALNDEDAQLRFELNVRDTPNLLAEFGPGRD